MKGKVIKSTGSWYIVLDEEGRQWECRLRGKIRLDGLRSTNPVAVGDNVVFEQEPEKETGVIKEIETRNNLIVRKSVNLSKASHIIASNIDLAKSRRNSPSTACFPHLPPMRKRSNPVSLFRLT